MTHACLKAASIAAPGRSTTLGSVAWTLASGIAPLPAAIIAVPVLLEALGRERFGSLLLAWAIVGYLLILDAGVGNATAKLTVDLSVTRRPEELAELFWSALAFTCGVGVAAGAGLAALTPWLMHSALKISPGLGQETAAAFYVLALAAPLIVSEGVLVGALQAFQRFGVISRVRIAQRVLFYLSPLAVLPFTRNLAWIVLAIMTVRVFAWAVRFWHCAAIMPGLLERRKVAWIQLRRVLQYGGWISLRSSIGSALEYSDRFFIGAVVSVGAVTWYAVPAELVAKLDIVGGSLMFVLFPSLVQKAATERRESAASLTGRAITVLLCTLFPLILLTPLLAGPALKLWLGGAFAAHSERILIVLAISNLVGGCLLYPTDALIRAMDRPDFLAKLRLGYTPLYLGALWLLIRWFGAAGAAAAVACRLAVEALACAALVVARFPAMRGDLIRTACWLGFATTAAVAIAAVPWGFGAHLLVAIGVIATFLPFAWKRLLAELYRRKLCPVAFSAS